MKTCLLEINADWRWERSITSCIIAITSATMAIKKCLGTVGLEHFMTAATMELKLLENERRQCSAIFDETYSMWHRETLSGLTSRPCGARGPRAVTVVCGTDSALEGRLIAVRWSCHICLVTPPSTRRL